jgi:hypothetical protein
VSDSLDLPAYEYTLDQTTDPRAEYQTFLSNVTSRDHWFQLGNARVVGLAHVDGTTELFDMDEVTLVRNHVDPASGAFGGGFGYLVDVDRGIVQSTHYEDLPSGSVIQRRFGVGYATRVIRIGELTLTETTAAPDGAVPGLVQTITLTNQGSQTQHLRYLPYWDVNLWERFPGLQETGGLSLAREWPLQAGFDSRFNGVVARPEEIPVDQSPSIYLFPTLTPVVFLAPLDTSVSGYDTAESSFFGEGGRTAPAALADLQTDNSSARPDPRGELQPACLVLSTEVELAPGASQTLSYVYGFTNDPEEIPEILAQLYAQGALGEGAEETVGEQVVESTRQAWAERLPRFDFSGYPALSRELTWSAWMLSSASLYSQYSQAFTVTQSGGYVYDYGLNSAPRDPLQHALALVYTDPGLAKETLRYWLRQQKQDGHLPYTILGASFQMDLLWKPSDFSLWLFLLAVEYVDATGDESVLTEVHPYYPEDGEGTGLEHLEAAWDYLLHDVGIGHNGLIKLRMYDWNDMLLPESASNQELLLTRLFGESTLNTAQAVYVLPRFAALLRRLGETAVSDEVEVVTDALRAALREQWRGDHFNRAYVGAGEELGDEVLYLEPQPWALLAEDFLSDEDAALLVEALRLRLRDDTGLGCRVLEVAHPTGEDEGEVTNAGIWASVNGWLAWGAGRRDPTFGFEELLDNSLASHATRFPEQWWGIWSGPDSYNSSLSDRPGETWYIPGLSMQAFPIQNLHPHAWPVFAALQLAGLEFSQGQLRLSPRLSLPEYSVETALYTLTVEPRALAFEHFRADTLTVRLEAPRHWTPDARRRLARGDFDLTIGGRKVMPKRSDEGILLRVRPGERVQLSLRAEKSRGGR